MEPLSASPLNPVATTPVLPHDPVPKTPPTTNDNKLNPFSNFNNPFDRLLCLLFEKDKINSKGYLQSNLQLPNLPDLPNHLLTKIQTLLDKEIEGISPIFTIRDLFTYFYKRGAKIELVGSSLQQFLGSNWFYEAVKRLAGEDLENIYSQQNLAFIDEQKNDIDFRITFKDSFDPVDEAEKFIQFLVERQYPERDKDPELIDAFRSKLKGPFEEFNPSILIHNNELINNGHLINLKTKDYKIDLFLVTVLKVPNIIQAQDLTFDFTSIFSDKAEKQLELKGENSAGWQCITDTATKVVHFTRFNTTAWKKGVVKFDSGFRTLESIPVEMVESLQRYCVHKNGIFEGISKLLPSIFKKSAESQSPSIVTLTFNIGFYLYIVGFPSPEIQKIIDGLSKLFPKNLSEDTAALGKGLQTLTFVDLIFFIQLKFLNTSQLISHLGMTCTKINFNNHCIYIPLKFETHRILQLEKTELSCLDKLSDSEFEPKEFTHPTFLEAIEQLLNSSNPSLRHIGIRLHLSNTLKAPSQQAWETFFFKIHEFKLSNNEIEALVPAMAAFFNLADIEKLRSLWGKCSKEEWILRLVSLKSKQLEEIAFKIWKKYPSVKDVRQFYTSLIAENPLFALQALCEVNENDVPFKEKLYLGDQLLEVAKNSLDQSKIAIASRILIEGTKSRFVHATPSVWIKYFEHLIESSKTTAKHLCNTYVLANQFIHFKKEHFRKQTTLLVNIVEKLYSSDEVDHQQLGHTLFTFLQEKYQDALSSRIKTLQQKYQEAVADQEAKQGRIASKIKIIEGGTSPHIKNLVIEVWNDLCKKCPLRSMQKTNIILAKNLINRIKIYFQNDEDQFSKLILMLIDIVLSMDGDDIIPVAHSVLESALYFFNEVPNESTSISILYPCIKLLIKYSDSQGPESLKNVLTKVQSKAFQLLTFHKDYKTLIELVYEYVKMLIDVDAEFLFDPVLTQATQLHKNDIVRHSVYELLLAFGTKRVCEGRHSIAPALQLQTIPGIVTSLFQKKKGQLALCWIKHYMSLLKVHPTNNYRVILEWAKRLHNEFEHDSVALFEFIEEKYFESSDELQAVFEDYPAGWVESNVKLCGRVIVRNLPIEKNSPLYAKIELFVTCFLKDKKDMPLSLKIIKEQPITNPEIISRVLQKGNDCPNDTQEEIWNLFLQRFKDVCPKTDSMVTIAKPWTSAWSYHLPLVTKIYDRKRSEFMYHSALAQLVLFTSKLYTFELDLDDKVFRNILSFLNFFAEMQGDLPRHLIDRLFIARRKLEIFNEKKQVQALQQFDMAFLKKVFVLSDGVIFHNGVYMLIKLFENFVEASKDFDQKRIDLVTLAIAKSQAFFHTSFDKTSTTACIMLLKLLDKIKPMMLLHPLNPELVKVLHSHKAFQIESPIIPYFEWSYQEREDLKVFNRVPVHTKQSDLPFFVKHLGFIRTLMMLLVMCSAYVYFCAKASKK